MRGEKLFWNEGNVGGVRKLKNGNYGRYFYDRTRPSDPHFSDGAENS